MFQSADHSYYILSETPDYYKELTIGADGNLSFGIVQTEKENIVELKTNIYLLSIIGEVEGHESLGERTKATRYEHILPALARAEEDKSIDGLLILLNLT